MAEATRILQPARHRGRRRARQQRRRDGRHGMRRLAVTHAADGWTRRGALDVERAEAVLQRLRRPQRPRLRLRRQHPVVHRSRRTARASGRAAATAAASSCCCADQDLLLVLSEEGELGAGDGDAGPVHRAGASSRRIEGKTWNHPVLVGDILLVRNGEEMAAFRLPLATR